MTRTTSCIKNAKVRPEWYCPSRWISRKVVSFERSPLKSDAQRFLANSAGPRPVIPLELPSPTVFFYWLRAHTALTAEWPNLEPVPNGAVNFLQSGCARIRMLFFINREEVQKTLCAIGKCAKRTWTVTPLGYITKQYSIFFLSFLNATYGTRTYLSALSGFSNGAMNCLSSVGNLVPSCQYRVKPGNLTGSHRIRDWRNLLKSQRLTL